MAFNSTTAKNTLATSFGTAATHAALYTTTAGASQGTEVTGGSPAYARKAITWSAPTNGVITASVTFDVPTGTTIVAAGVHTAASGGSNYLEGGTVTSQAFGSQGTYTLNLTCTIA